MRFHTTLLAATMATPALAVPIELGVTPASSPYTLEACVAPAGFSENCDTVNGTIGGTISACVDNAASPGQISLRDFDLAITTGVTFVFDYGFFGSVTVAINDLSFVYDGVDPQLPTAVDGAGAFNAIQVPVRAIGSGSVSGSGVVGALVTPGPVDIDSPGASDLAGVISSDGSTVTLTSMLPIAQMDEIDGIAFNINGTATISASGTPGCAADVNADGDATPADFTAWLAAFNNPADPNRARADVNCDGSLSPADFTAWLSAFSIGCD